MFTTTKKVITNSRVKGNYRPQEFNYSTTNKKIFPESFSALPVNGSYFKTAS